MRKLYDFLTSFAGRFFAIWVILLAMGVYSSFIGSISSTVNSLRAVRGEKIKQHSWLQVLPVQDSNADQGIMILSKHYHTQIDRLPDCKSARAGWVQCISRKAGTTGVSREVGRNVKIKGRPSE